jgi:N-acetyl-S-(2-succino)cysteine monooxygenase
MMKLSVFLSPTGGHLGGWRLPEAYTDAGLNFSRFVEFAQLAERGKFDMIFLADGNGVQSADNLDLLSQTPTFRPAVMEPLMLLSALATVTTRVGLVGTATTTYDEPYSIARRLAALDQISQGRAGWNVVTSSNPEDSRNFSREEHLLHADRYARAEEFLDVVKDLWDSWDDGAFIRDKTSGRFFDPAKARLLNHRGKHFSVRGPLNAARPPQGHPVIVQAGGSEPAKEMAARVADAIFTIAETKDYAQAFYADVKQHAAKFGRPPDAIKVLPGCAVFVGETDEQAEELYQRLQSLIPTAVGVQALSKVVSADLSAYPVDGPFPELTGEVRGVATFRKIVIEMAKRDKLTIRQAYERILPARGHFLVKGNPRHVADQLEDWYTGKAADGFNLVVPYLPGALRDFVDLVVPELQRRGLFRKEYEGTSFRQNLGVPRPVNRFFQKSSVAAE